MNTILVIDDELVNLKNTLRKDIGKFGNTYGYKMIFIEAPDPEELKDKINRDKPSAVFLDIVHKRKQYNIASLLRKEIGSEVPILILTNYTKKQLEEENKKFNEIIRDLEEKTSFIEKNIKLIREKLQDDALKREVREPLSDKLRELEKLEGNLQDYKEGTSPKKKALTTIQTLIEKYKGDKSLVESLNKLKVSLTASSMLDYFGSKYPTDFRQIIGYVLKDNFINMQELINNGIIASINPDNSIFSLDVSKPLVSIKDYEGKLIGKIKDKLMCEQFEKFANSSDLCCKIHSDIDKARKVVSDINNSIYDATKWILRDVLKNTGSGKYKLDIGRFIVDGKTIKDFEMTSQPLDVSKQINKALTILNNLKEKIEGLEKRVESLENRLPKE